MSTVAEILANPSKFSPDTVMRAAIRKYGSDVKKIVAYFRSKGMVIQPGDVKRWVGSAKKKTSAPKGKAKAKKRKTAKKAKKAKKTKGRKTGGKAKWKVSYTGGRKKKGKGTSGGTMAKKMKKMFGDEWYLPGGYDQSGMADSEVGKSVKRKKKRKTKTKTTKRKNTMAKKRKGKSVKKAAPKKALKLKGRKVRGKFTGKIAHRVGSRISDDVAMNPAFSGIASLFSNPALDLSMEGIVGNVWNGGQAALGAVGGMAAAKYARDLLISKIIQKDQTAPTMLQRVLSGVACMVVVPPLVKAVLPNRLGENLARGIVTGAGLYIVSGIELGGKKLLPIGEMVGADEQEIIIDSQVGADYTVQPMDETAASEDYTVSDGVAGDYSVRYTQEVADATEMQDTVSGYPNVGDGVTEYSEEVF